jgi:hypothetical protein
VIGHSVSRPLRIWMLDGAGVRFAYEISHGVLPSSVVFNLQKRRAHGVQGFFESWPAAVFYMATIMILVTYVPLVTILNDGEREVLLCPQPIEYQEFFGRR